MRVSGKLVHEVMLPYDGMGLAALFYLLGFSAAKDATLPERTAVRRVDNQIVISGETNIRFLAEDLRINFPGSSKFMQR